MAALACANPPKMGEKHTDDVLREAGLSAAQISEMREGRLGRLAVSDFGKPPGPAKPYPKHHGSCFS